MCKLVSPSSWLFSSSVLFIIWLPSLAISKALAVSLTNFKFPFFLNDFFPKLNFAGCDHSHDDDCIVQCSGEIAMKHLHSAFRQCWSAILTWAVGCSGSVWSSFRSYSLPTINSKSSLSVSFIERLTKQSSHNLSCLLNLPWFTTQTEGTHTYSYTGKNSRLSFLNGVGFIWQCCLVLVANLIDHGCHTSYKTTMTMVTRPALAQHAMA